MVFHALDVLINHAVLNTQQSEELGEELVSLRDPLGQFFTSDSQDKAAILLVFKQSLGIEPLNHVRDARLRDI